MVIVTIKQKLRYDRRVRVCLDAALADEVAKAAAAERITVSTWGRRAFAAALAKDAQP